MSQTDAGRDRLVAGLVGEPCNHCDDGNLERGQHKGSPAIVCGECEVPQVCFR